MEAVLISLKMRYATVKYSWNGSKMKDFYSLIQISQSGYCIFDPK